MMEYRQMKRDDIIKMVEIWQADVVSNAFLSYFR